MSRRDPYDDDEDDDRPRRRRRRDDDEDDRPRRRRDDDEDDRPSRASRDRYGDERDDFDDDYRPRRGPPGDGMAIAAMIVGLIAMLVTLVGWCCCGVFGSVGGAVIGVVAVILGFISRSQGSRSGMGVTGIILGFVAIFLGIVMTILLLIGVAWMQANQGKWGAPGGGGGGGIQRNKF